MSAYVTCELTPRCSTERACRHHADGCEHAEQWEKDHAEWNAVMDELNADMALTKRVIGLLQRTSMTNRRMVMELLWQRFHERPRCDDDPPEGA